MTDPVLQTSLEGVTWLGRDARVLPGVQPLAANDWLRVDEAFGGQMRLKDGLLGGLQEDVYAQLPEAEDAAQECLDQVLAAVATNPSYDVGPRRVIRPDGVKIVVDRAYPLLTIGRLIQEDICILQKRGDEHVLTGALLCFPASWTLAEKIGRPLIRIHRPVDEYDQNIARRVQRLFDGVKAGRPLWRANAMTYASSDLFHPRREADGHRPENEARRYLRSERQTIHRLPQTGAVVFGIHTYLWDLATLPPEVRDAFAA